MKYAMYCAGKIISGSQSNNKKAARRKGNEILRLNGLDFLFDKVYIKAI